MSTISRVAAALSTLLLLTATVALSAADELAIRGGTILTVTNGSIENGVILIRDGKIVAIGKDVEVPAGCEVIDATGKWIMPGIIDAHSHIALGGDTNEMSSPVTPEVRMADALVPDAYSIYLALAGGTTASKLMHGSANVIGGVNVTVKLKYNRPVEEMIIPGVRQQIKWALGENPKRVYGSQGRMPATRPGIFAILRQELYKARDYKESWERYEQKKAAGEDAVPPKRDLKMDALAAVLSGELSIDTHCYVAHEIIPLLQIAKEFDLKTMCLSHALAGYKVRDEIARSGFHVLTHTDWWGYKYEAFDAIPYMPGMMMRAGINTAIISDSGDVMRRLNGEAAKVVRYSGVSDDEALAMITINAARALEIDDRCGSLEVGKDADIAVFDRHPLDSFGKCVLTLIEGEVFFDIENAHTALER